MGSLESRMRRTIIIIVIKFRRGRGFRNGIKRIVMRRKRRLRVRRGMGSFRNMRRGIIISRMKLLVKPYTIVRIMKRITVSKEWIRHRIARDKSIIGTRHTVRERRKGLAGQI